MKLFRTPSLCRVGKSFTQTGSAAALRKSSAISWQLRAQTERCDPAPEQSVSAPSDPREATCGPASRGVSEADLDVHTRSIDWMHVPESELAGDVDSRAATLPSARTPPAGTRRLHALLHSNCSRSAHRGSQGCVGVLRLHIRLMNAGTALLAAPILPSQFSSASDHSPLTAVPFAGAWFRRSVFGHLRLAYNVGTLITPFVVGMDAAFAPPRTLDRHQTKMAGTPGRQACSDGAHPHLVCICSCFGGSHAVKIPTKPRRVRCFPPMWFQSRAPTARLSRQVRMITLALSHEVLTRAK